MPTRQDLNRVTSTISGLDISTTTLNTFQFINKGPTINQAWSLLSGGDLSGYLVAEQINALRDVISALMQVEKQTTPAVNTLINNPNNFMNLITPEFYDKNLMILLKKLLVILLVKQINQQQKQYQISQIYYMQIRKHFLKILIYYIFQLFLCIK